ncbi:MAG: hypothetical protein ACRBK7_13995 [Acidimicrobiales bacterium]
MGTKTAAIAYCEHGEVVAACLECLAMPKKITPPPPATPRATKNPSSAKDKISPLAGDLDMSIPVNDVDKLIGSPSLSARAFPHYLRRSGWIYLRTDDRLEARVKATKVVWQDERDDLVDPDRDLGAGIVIEVDTLTWDSDIDIDLGKLAPRMRDGFRYLKTNEDDTVTHYMGGKPIVELTEEEELDLTENS